MIRKLSHRDLKVYWYRPYGTGRGWGLHQSYRRSRWYRHTSSHEGCSDQTPDTGTGVLGIRHSLSRPHLVDILQSRYTCHQHSQLYTATRLLTLS